MRVMTKRNNGTFVRTREIWTPENWDDGYTDNRGRFRVYRPDYPRAYSEGYCLRAHVVWWLEHGEPHPKGKELHHIDGSKDNDKIENLIPLSNSEHQKLHRGNPQYLICKNCKKEFITNIGRINSRGVLFCSQKCYHLYPKPFRKQKRICPVCEKEYIVIPASTKNTCSISCGQILKWRRIKCEEF